MKLDNKSDVELDQWIANHESSPGGTTKPLYSELLEERARRTQSPLRLNLELSLDHLKNAAKRQVCITYGELAAASNVKWTQAHYQMNGSAGHLERLIDLCHARGLPHLTAICVNQAGVNTGELGEEALAGFIAGVRRIGVLISDDVAFHNQCREECWAWGRAQPLS